MTINGISMADIEGDPDVWGNLIVSNYDDYGWGFYAIENLDNSQGTLGYEIALKWGFSDAISEYLFE